MTLAAVVFSVAGVTRTCASETRLAASETRSGASDHPVNPAQKTSAETAWIDESIASASWTGEWSQAVLYNRTTRRANLEGEYIFTPNEPSAGKYVTVKVVTTFNIVEDSDYVPDASAQGAVGLGANGSFQVWTLGKCCQCGNVANTNVANVQLELGIGTGDTGNIGNIPTWLDVAAQGVTPVAGQEYEVSMVFDYVERRYSVSVKDEQGVWRRLEAAGGDQAFPMAAKADRIETITFEGKTKFHSLKGSYTSNYSTGSQRSQSNVRISPPGAGEANRTFESVRQEPAESIERSNQSAGSRRSKSNVQIGSLGDGEANRTAF